MYTFIHGNFSLLSDMCIKRYLVTPVRSGPPQKSGEDCLAKPSITPRFVLLSLACCLSHSRSLYWSHPIICSYLAQAFFWLSLMLEFRFQPRFLFFSSTSMQYWYKNESYKIIKKYIYLYICYMCIKNNVASKNIMLPKKPTKKRIMQPLALAFGCPQKLIPDTRYTCGMLWCCTYISHPPIRVWSDTLSERSKNRGGKTQQQHQQQRRNWDLNSELWPIYFDLWQKKTELWIGICVGKSEIIFMGVPTWPDPSQNPESKY